MSKTATSAISDGSSVSTDIQHLPLESFDSSKITPCDEVCELEIPANDWLTAYIYSEECILKKYRNLSVQFHRGKIHIFICTSVDDTQGVYMDMRTWIEFCEKIWSFSLLYACESSILNNCISAIVDNEQLLLQHMIDSDQHLVMLDYEELQYIKDCMSSINTFIVNHMLCKQLHTKVCGDVKQVCIIDGALINLKKIIISDLSRAVLEMFKCNGCINRSCGQLRHECLIMSDIEKFASVGNCALLLLDVDAIGMEFNAKNRPLPIELDFSNLCDTLFQ